MPEPFHSTPPFFERTPNPPPPLPLLVAQTDIFYHVLRLPPLLGQVPLPKIRPVLSSHYAGADTRKVTIVDPHSFSDPEDDDRADTESPTPTTDAVFSNADIDKPQGENGRPGRGGYTLASVLRGNGWKAKEVEAFKRRVSVLVAEHLNETKTITMQNPYLLETVFNKALEEFPNLDHFDSQWPTYDTVKARLAYTSRKTKARKNIMPATQASPGRSQPYPAARIARTRAETAALNSTDVSTS